MPRPAVFLDRDDTLIRCTGVAPDGDLGDPALVQPLPGANEACALLRQAGFALFVVTNQGGVARGRYTSDDVDRVHARVNELLNGAIDDFRHCPFHPKGTVPAFTCEHPWRKPAPGMLLDLASAHAIDLAASWMIGDAARDCEAGQAAGCRTVLVGAADPSGAADHIADDVLGAARLILEHTGSDP